MSIIQIFLPCRQLILQEVMISYKLFKPRSKLLVRSKFFTNRVIDLWNSLPYQVINAQSTIEFKNNLDIFWAEKGYGHHKRPMAY